MNSCNLSVGSPINGQVFSTTDGNYNATNMSLSTSSSCQGTINWSFNWSYQTGNGNTCTGLTPTQSVLNQSANYSPDPGSGGQASVNISGAASGGIITYIDGVQIPASSITAQLVNLYTGARTYLLTGIAEQESSYLPFTYRSNYYLISGYWPTESYDGGSHVGLMQVPMSMQNAFDWTANMRAGASIFYSKRQSSYSYNSNQVNLNPNLRDLTDIEVENDALVFYGPYGSSGHYYVPNSPAPNATDWIVNPNNPNGVNYANSVVSKMQ